MTCGLPAASRKVAPIACEYFVPQRENMTDLDAAHDVERALAVGRRIALDHVADVGDAVGLAAVAAEVDAAQVKVGFVGAADEIAHDRDGRGRR